MIRVKNLYKSFNGVSVLSDISVTFETGKTNLIIGRSGSGKTVLLKSLVGLHEIDRGEIWYDEGLFNQMNFSDKKRIRSEMGMLFQGALFSILSLLNRMFAFRSICSQTKILKRRCKESGSASTGWTYAIQITSIRPNFREV